jgi:hypothetical protein
MPEGGLWIFQAPAAMPDETVIDGALRNNDTARLLYYAGNPVGFFAFFWACFQGMAAMLGV